MIVLQVPNKINLRLMVIVVVCGIIAAAAAAAIYKDAMRKANPETLVPVVIFGKDVKMGEVVEKDAVMLAKWPVSQAPSAAIEKPETVVGKRLAYSVHKGQPAFADTAVERGFEQVQTDGFEVGIDVTNISNVLGAQLRPGDNYLLLHRQEGGGITSISMVTVTGLVDAAGKQLVNESGVAKTVNVALDQQETMLQVVSLKGTGEFELVKAPVGYVVSAGQTVPATPANLAAPSQVQ